MRTLDVARNLDVPAEAVWDALVDIRQWPRWGPSVSGASLDSGSGADGYRIGPGSTGRVRTAVGVSLPFEVTDFDVTDFDVTDFDVTDFDVTDLSGGRRWAWRVAGVAATGHRVEPTGPRSCRAVIEVPVWAPAYAPLCWVALGRLGRVAAGGAP